MDESFQNKIDEFILHEDKMCHEDIAKFHRELEVDAKKKEQFEFSCNLKKALESRESKQRMLLVFRTQYESEKSKIKNQKIMKRILIWTSSVAAVFVISVFMIRPLISSQLQSSSDANPTINDNYIFGSEELQNKDSKDTTKTNSTKTDSIIEQKSAEIDLSWDTIK